MLAIILRQRANFIGQGSPKLGGNEHQLLGRRSERLLGQQRPCSALIEIEQAFTIECQ